MTINEAYYSAVNLAYTLGCENFDVVMPEPRAKNFLKGYLAAKGFEKFQNDSVRALALAACRLERIQHRPCPQSDFPSCIYRKSMQSSFYSTTRPTAFRTEVICPTDRCGFDLKDGHLGGDFFDYEPCHRLAK